MAGRAAAGFEAVREEFDRLRAAEPGYTAQVAVYHRGVLVADLWCGPEIGPGSLLAIASCTKGAAYLCAALLVQRGDLALDAPVAGYWPEFGAAGKGGITVRQLLSHRAGLIGVDGGFTLDDLHDDRALASRLAGQRPFWRPGAGHGYHGFTMGALVGELVRRISGEPLAEFYASEVRRPRDIDLFVGLPAAYEDRVLDLQPPPARPPGSEPAGSEPAGSESVVTGLREIASAAVVGDPVAAHNTRRIGAAGPASSGGMASARGLARLYACCVSVVDGLTPLLTPETAAEFARPHSVGLDLVLGYRNRYGLGFQVPDDGMSYLSARAFGHDGGGGCWGFADPVAGVAFGYVRRRVTGPDDDGERLARAALRSAAADVTGLASDCRAGLVDGGSPA